MNRERHVQIERSGPEAIILAGWKSTAAGHRRKKERKLLKRNAGVAREAERLSRSAVGRHRVRAIGELDDLWSAISILRRHPVGPHVRVQVKVGVRGDELIITGQRFPPL